MKTILTTLLLLSSLSFGDVTYTESKTYIGTIRYYTITTSTQKCSLDYVVETKKIISKFCFSK